MASLSFVTGTWINIIYFIHNFFFQISCSYISKIINPLWENIEDIAMLNLEEEKSTSMASLPQNLGIINGTQRSLRGGVLFPYI